MFSKLLPSRRLRREAPRTSSGRVDRRSGAPARRGPEPMPRMRWYS